MDSNSNLSKIDWEVVEQDLLERGYRVLDSVLTDAQCDRLVADYEQPSLFRKTVVMGRHQFGKGEYKYFNYPLPGLVQTIRQNMYSPLASVANSWAEKLGDKKRWPESYELFLDECSEQGQIKPTPLMLQYKTGDYNRLHQDMYGEVYFPFQIIFLLSEPDKDFSGGSLILVENYPRVQSRPHAPQLKKGSAVIIPTQDRPIPGSRTWRRAKMRHGVSEIMSGRRYTLGVIFHDA